MFSRSTLLLAVTALSGLVAAQNYSTSGPLSIDVTQIPAALRLSWCTGQRNSCPMICGGTASMNNCDDNSLNYTCTCPGSIQPNISNYDQTIPSFVCGQWRINCVANHPNDLVGITACQSVVCGMKNASSGVSSASAAPSSTSAASTSSSMASTSATAKTSSSATAATTSAAATKGAAATVHLAQNFGTSVLAAGLLAVFGLAL